ncbi:MAG TPA: mucoidy inhibitor MuiA family protein [Gemmataceae bacterium]|nr:mucoidy inhibitor MuiA family protein [Gemmataceae bacterium]
MWKRVFALLALGSLALLLGFATRSEPANPPTDVERPAEKQAPKEAVPAAPPAVKVAPSRVAAVTVYPNSALVTREVDVADGAGTFELTVTPLPPNTINSSLYTEGSEGIRVLTTRFRSRAVLEDTREDVRKLQDDLKQLQLAREKLEAEMKAVQENAQTLSKMENFMSITTVQSAEKGALNSDSAIALSKHVRESRLDSARELVGLKQQIQANQEKAEFAQRRLNELATGTARTERDAVIVVEKANGAAGKVRLNYLVDAASWHPQYKVRAGKAANDAVQVEYLAAVMQHTGEDWSGVKLALSTAQPALNAAPPELQLLQVTAVPTANAPAAVHHADAMEVEDQVRSLRSKAQKNFNEKKQSSGVGLVNTAAALDQSWELFNPEAAIKRGCALAVREGPTVTYHLSSKLTVPSRHDEQVLEVARLDLQPDYYYKAVPLLSSQVYRLADLTNKSQYVLLPGEATMYIGSDFVGQMALPLVAVGEQFTAGFGVDPQLQVQRQMTDKSRATQGANQALRYEYRILLSSFKAEAVKLQVWDRLPHPENEAVTVSLLKAAPDLSKDAVYLREQRPNNLLRWDVTVAPNTSGEKAVAINYEFKLELDRQLTISSFQTAGVLASVPAPANAAPVAMAALSAEEQGRIKVAMAKLSPEDRRLAEAQVFCAVDQDSPLGSMGPIFKEIVKGQPVFLCCKGCVAEARAHPDETLAQFQKLMARMTPKK